MKVLQKILFVSISMVIFFFMYINARELSRVEIICEPNVKIYINDEFKGITTRGLNGMIIDNLRQGIYDIRAVRGKASPRGKYAANHRATDEMLEKEFEIENNTTTKIMINFSENRMEISSKKIREERPPNDFNQNTIRHNSQNNRIKRKEPTNNDFNQNKIRRNSQENRLKKKEPINMDININDNNDWPSPNEFVPVDIMPEMVYQAPPEYIPMNDGVTRTVWVKALVDKKGMVKKAIIDKSSRVDAFDKAALEAAYKNRFKPAIKDGKPVFVWVMYEVKFQ
ncbi:MAG: energy transducer TonB [FCB group bacterium]|nr:energy transducer TonB [FCB group bacterium]